MEYYSALKGVKFCHLTKWMEMEVIVLTEINQVQKDKYCNSTHMWNIKKKIDLTDVKSIMVPTRDQEERDG